MFKYNVVKWLIHQSKVIFHFHYLFNIWTASVVVSILMKAVQALLCLCVCVNNSDIQAYSDLITMET